jgi:hypothetical protein
MHLLVNVTYVEKEFLSTYGSESAKLTYLYSIIVIKYERKYQQRRASHSLNVATQPLLSIYLPKHQCS